MESVTLQEIAEWAKAGAQVQIPPFQRGVVWKPQQVELLWDSILRGFPIGSFILSEESKTTESGRKYDLMDGQQRFNAIALGYNTLGQDDISYRPTAIIWIDIAPESTEKCSRRFWIRITTSAHPWGYRNNDECATLSASERRDALEKFGIAADAVYNRPLDLFHTYPYFAKRPLPLHYLLQASSAESEERFVENIKRQIEENREKYIYIERFGKLTVEDCARLKTLFHPFRKLRNYRIGIDMLFRSVLDDEADQTKDNTEQTALEILFTRLNTGGTRISQEDLHYSAIKAYWPEIKAENDRLAQYYMSPSRLAMLAFRLELSENELSREVDIRKIRELKANDQIKDRVQRLYAPNASGQSELSRIVEQIDRWFGIPDEIETGKVNGDTGMPRVIRTSIAVNSPDTYLLLMWLARKHLRQEIRLTAPFITGLALYLHWFSQDNRRCVDLIFSAFRQSGVSPSSILSAVYDAIRQGYLIGLYTPRELENLFKIGKAKDWNIWHEDYRPWQNFYNRIAWQGNQLTREMLLWAQKEFLNRNFRAYDPARQDLWAEQNRPWDFDHIIPQDWIARKRGEYLEYCKYWLNNIGNIAAIPFTVNRQKSNNADFDIYLQHPDELLYQAPDIAIGKDLIQHAEAANSFARNTHRRCYRIYTKCHEAISPLFSEATPEYSDTIRRKALYEQIMTRLKTSDGTECRCYFVADDREYELKRDEDWCRPWISIGVPATDKYMISFTTLWPDTTKKGIFEIGLRRCPGDSKLNPDVRVRAKKEYFENTNGWWYLYKNYSECPPVEQICTEMEKLMAEYGNN